ncbi:hypothetical protein ACHAXR_005077, partial [Thalassiosira sp. AJA248-18]
YGFDSARLGRSARELERRANNNVTTATGTGGNGRMDEEEKKDGETMMGGGGGRTSFLIEGGGSTAGGGNESHPLANLEGGATLQQILSSHHEHCVKTALRQAREWTTKQAQARVDARLQGDWEMEREKILGRGVLGNRFLMGSSSSGGGGGGDISGGGVASRVPLLEGDDTMTIGAAATTTSSPLWSNIVPSPQILPPTAEGLVKSHLAAIDKHLTSTSTTAQSSMKLLASLQDGLNNATTNNSGLNPESMTGYFNAFSLLRSIGNCTASLGLNLSSDNNTVNDTNVVAASVMGACNFFANQFASHVKEVVREAELAGMVNNNPTANNDLTMSSSIARDVCAFASIVAGRDVVEGRGGVWPRLFYCESSFLFTVHCKIYMTSPNIIGVLVVCLRCGDLAAANSILQQFVSGNNSSDDMTLVDPVVSNIISQLATLQETQETIFGDSTNGNTRPMQLLQNSLLNPTQSIMQSRRQVSDLYERSKTRSSSSSADASTEPFMYYRTACLAMLGGNESISEAASLESSGLVRTVEDYLFGSLWHALHLAENVSSSAAIVGGGVNGGGLQKVAEAVARLSVLVKEWGPSYFEQDEDVNGNMYTSASASVAHAAQGGVVGGASALPHKVPRSGGWAYTLPLLVTQQYTTALAYLAEAGGGLGLLQATHLGVAMNVAGYSIGDFTLEEQANSSNSTLLPMLVASYSATLQVFDAAAALKYLVLLSDKGKFVKDQVQRLMLETRQYEILAGKIEPNGTRSNGALDAHFSRKEVSTLLVDAANHAVRVGKPADAAELLVLSGRFGALFSLMNRELASYLNASPNTEDFAKRQFWFNAASQFHAHHLDQGKTYVQNNLDAEGNMALGNTFQLLMNLVVFFDRCRDQQWEGAWVLMDNLKLIPKTEAEMTAKVEAFRALDSCVRQVFHHIVLATMEALCHLFRNLKQSGGRISDAGSGGGLSIYQNNTIDQGLNEFRNRTRLLVTFARLLNLPSLGDVDTYVRISQLEKNMM